MRIRPVLAAAAMAFALTGCPDPKPHLTPQLERQTDLPRPSTEAQPGLSGDLLPPGFPGAAR